MRDLTSRLPPPCWSFKDEVFLGLLLPLWITLVLVDESWILTYAMLGEEVLGEVPLWICEEGGQL